MWSHPTGTFEVKPIHNPWVAQSVVADVLVPSWRDDPVKKLLFAQELSKQATPFDAALAVFGADTASALWASVHWVSDPIVLSARQSVALTNKILDKDALCHKLANISEEKSPQGYYLIEPKDRIACWKLYAEIQGYIGKVEAATFNNFANNNLKVVFVKPDNDHHKIKTIKQIEPEVIEHQDDEPVLELENQNDFKPLPKLRMI